MMNANSGAVESSNSRGFAAFAGGQQGVGSDAGFQQPGNFGGIQSVFGATHLHGTRASPGFVNMPMHSGGQSQQAPQGRYPSGNLSSQLQQMSQYAPMPGRSSLPGGQLLAMNGIGGGRGSPGLGHMLAQQHAVSESQQMGVSHQQLSTQQQQQQGSQQIQQGRGSGLGLSGNSIDANYAPQGFANSLNISSSKLGKHLADRMGGNYGAPNSSGFAPSNIVSPGRGSSLSSALGHQQPQQQLQLQSHLRQPGLQQQLQHQPGLLNQLQQQQHQHQQQQHHLQQHPEQQRQQQPPQQQQQKRTNGDLLSILDARNKLQLGMAGAVVGKTGQASIPQGNSSGKQGEPLLAFDEADFPSLGGGPARPSGGLLDAANGIGSSTSPTSGVGQSAAAGAPVPSSESYGGLQMAGKGQEFNIQAEEFPALPGAPRASGEGGDAAQPEDSGREDGAVVDPPRPQSGHPDYEETLRFYAQQQQQQQQQGEAAHSQISDASQAGSGPDVFGLMGLLNVIRMTDPDLTTLALGTDLTTLGLNLNSSDSLHKTFASPWSDAPLTPEPEFKAGYFAKFQQDTLFYIFYSMPADEAQLLAADELSARQWWYHKDFKVWLTRIPNTEPILKTARFERGSYLVFDTTTWDAVRKDNFMVHYDSLERPPDLLRPPPGIAPGAGPGASALKPLGSAPHAGLAPGSAL